MAPLPVTQFAASNVERFIAEQCVPGSGVSTGADLYERYRAWSSERGLYVASRIAFGRILGAKFQRIIHGGLNSYFGLALRPVMRRAG